MFGQQRAAGLHHTGPWSWGEQYQPVLDGGSGVLAAAHEDHDDGEEEEEAGHGEAHAVHRLVADNDVAVHLVVDARYGRATETETWNLTVWSTQKEIMGGQQEKIELGQLECFYDTEWPLFLRVLVQKNNS